MTPSAREWQRRGGRISSSEEMHDYVSGEFYNRWQGTVPKDANALRDWLMQTKGCV